MGTRELILGRIAAALEGADRTPAAEYRYGAVAAVEDLAGLFVERVEDYRAVVERVDPGLVPTVVGRAVAGSAHIVVPPALPQEWLSSLGDVEAVADDGNLAPDELDRMDGVVTAAALGIAETGTIVLDHGPDQGRRALSLVPDLHVCVVLESQLVGDVPESIPRLRDAVGAGRPLTWISGPSATSDIELERVEGVHGPRRLHVLLVSA